jgi:hypothetical protein
VYYLHFLIHSFFHVASDSTT